MKTGNFNPSRIFEKMTSFSQILNQDLERGKFSGNKGPKSMIANDCNILNLPRKDLLCTKKKNNNGFGEFLCFVREFDHNGT